MRKFAYAVAAMAVLGVVAAADQSATSQPVAAPSAPKPAAVKMAPAHAAAKPAGTAGLPVDSQNQLVGQYCATCHSEKGKAGQLSLAGFDAAKIDKNTDVAEKMIRKLRAGMMPPPGARRPDAATVGAFVNALETRIDSAAAVNPNPGWRPFQRLNRAEYARAVRDLLGFDVDVNSFLPPDTVTGLITSPTSRISPTLMEGYLRAASQISWLRSATATPARLR
jgi:hypothetical protein